MWVVMDIKSIKEAEGFQNAGESVPLLPMFHKESAETEKKVGEWSLGESCIK